MNIVVVDIDVMISYLKVIILFIVKMMDRYYRPPEMRGRPVRLVDNGRHRRHYWFEKGKNYGFFTTPEEELMNQRRNNHQRPRH